MQQLRDILDKALGHYNTNKAFALYAKPSESVLHAVFARDAAPEIGAGFIFAPFKGAPILIPEETSECFNMAIPNGLPINESKAVPDFTVGKNRYEHLVSKGIDAIRDGQFSKLVLSRKERVAVSSFDFHTVFPALLVAYPEAFRYAYFHPQAGFWMGATPERLVKVENGRVQTVALAGTQPFIGTMDVQWGEKELAEQRFVTDYIVSNLSGIVSDIQLSEPKTVKAGNLLHIKTDVEATLGTTLESLVNTLHPTPAVCGLPKAEARQFIIANEGYARDFYSGYLGQWHPERQTADLYVNLRCMHWQDDAAQLYMGCGITADSNPEKEYIETVNKSMTMKKILL